MLQGNLKKTNSATGSGIIIGSTDVALVEYSVAHHNGEFNAHFGGGPYGIWTAYSNAVILQYNIAFNNSNGGTNTDGGGFDIDGGCTNSVCIYIKNLFCLYKIDPSVEL